jgi:hypothetical protein
MGAGEEHLDPDVHRTGDATIFTAKTLQELLTLRDECIANDTQYDVPRRALYECIKSQTGARYIEGILGPSSARPATRPDEDCGYWYSNYEKLNANSSVEKVKASWAAYKKFYEEQRLQEEMRRRAAAEAAKRKKKK